MRGLHLIVSFVTVFLLIAIFYINFTFYAGVISVGIFGGLLTLSLFYGLYGLFKKGKNRQAIFLNGGMIILTIIIFVLALPNYTYEEAKQMAAHDYHTDNVDIVTLDDKTVPVDKSSSWLLYEQFYYVGIKDEQNHLTYYAINPASGTAIKLQESY